MNTKYKNFSDFWNRPETEPKRKRNSKTIKLGLANFKEGGRIGDSFIGASKQIVDGRTYLKLDIKDKSYSTGFPEQGFERVIFPGIILKVEPTLDFHKSNVAGKTYERKNESKLEI